jgi:hypothetical protein
MKVMLAAALLFMPAPLWAQGTLDNWPELNRSALASVYVLDVTGTETVGTLVGFDADAIVLLVDGAERRIDAAQVRRIDKRGDSLRNGVIIGSAVGLAFGALSAGISDCPEDVSCAAFRAIGFVAGTLIYTSIGVAIDAAVTGRTRLYEAPSQGARVAAGIRLRW